MNLKKYVDIHIQGLYSNSKILRKNYTKQTYNNYNSGNAIYFAEKYHMIWVI